MPNKKKLYNALVKEGYDNFDSEESFNAYIGNAGNRKTLFNALKQEGYDNFEDEKAFDEYLGFAEPYTHEYDENKNLVGGTAYQAPEPYQYKPEVQQHILQNKPDMFKPKQSLMDAPLGINAPEGSDEKFQARINVAQKNLQDPEYQKSRVKFEFRVLSDSVNADLEKIEDAITSRQKSVRNIDWKPGMPSSRDDAKLSELRGQRTYLEGAKELIEDSQNILNAVEAEKDGSFFGGLGRGVRDKAFDIDTWTMGLSDLVGGLRLKSVLEKAEKGENLTPAEQKLLDASVNNMAVNFYYRNDLGLGYQAGEITGQSIPFMLEFLVNPVSASGNAMAKRLLTYGLKRFGSAVNSKAIKAGTRLATDALAAGGVTSTTGMGHVLSGGVERLNRNYEYGLDEEGNLNVVNTHNMGVGEAFAKSATSAFLERQSEMIFNAFRGAPSLFKGIETSLPGGVNTFMNYVRNSRLGELWRGIKNNATMKELAERTQFHGLGEEYLEEVYNNFANIPLGEMTFEEATDLENNIVTFLGLAPTQVMFSAIGGIGYGVERYKAKKDLERTFGKMTEEQKRKLIELQEMGKLSTNKDIAFFLAETIKDESLTPEQKRAKIEYAYNLAKQNAIDEVSNTDLEDTIESENQQIDAATDPQTGMYGEVSLVSKDLDGNDVVSNANVFGEKEVNGELYLLVLPEGETEKKWVRPNQYDANSYQKRPAEEVKALNEEMIREEAARQAEQEAKYAPEVLNAQMQQGVPFDTPNAQIIPVAPMPEGNGWIVEEYALDTNNKVAKTLIVRELTNDEYRDILQAQLNAEEAAQEQIAAEAQAAAPEVVEEAQPTEEADVKENITTETGNNLSSVEEVAQPQAEVKPQTPVIPTKEDGSIDFVSYGKEGTFKTLGEKYGEKMPNKVAVTAKALAEDLKKAQNKLQKAEETYDNAPIGREQKAEEARDNAKQELEAIQREANFWAEMDEEIKDAQARRESVLNPQAEVETSTEPMNVDEFVAQQLAAGNIILDKEDYKKETGYSNAEANAMNGGSTKLFGKNGMTIQEAGERLMEIDRENETNFFDQEDANAGRDALINLLGSVKNRKELNQYIANAREEQAKKESEGLRNELEKQVMEANYASLEDYVLQMEAAEMEENPFRDIDVAQIDAIFVEAEEEYQNYINNEQGRTSEVVEGDNNVLPEEQADYTGGTSGVESEGNSERNGEGTSEASESTHAATEVELKQEEGETTLQFAERAAEENRRRPLRKRAEEWSNTLGIKVTYLESIDDVDADTRREIEAAHAKGKSVPGWVNKKGEVFFFMPDLSDLKDVDDTYIHEVVAHVGLPQLLGKERFGELCDKVWEMMPQSAKDYYMSYPGVNNHRDAADEYIAHLAEQQNLTPEEKTIWDNIVKMFRELLDKALNGIISKSKLTDEDISNLIKASYANLKSGAEGSVESSTRFKVYKSKDGKETKYKQLSLFGEGNEAANDGDRPDNIQREGDSTIERLNHLRELQKGEICNVERKFTESKEFSFTKGEKIESAADVAYIFKSLEDEAIENSFVAVTNGDNVTVLHLGMGAQTQTVADTTAIFAAVERLGADKIFFVHNHPTGNVKCSRQDVQTYQALKDTFGDKLQDGIIINTRSGKYGLFNSSGLVDDEGRIKEEKDEYPISVYKFNKQVFNVDEIPSVSPSSYGIAEFVSTQRLGKRDKINALLLNNNFGCVGNILIDNSKNTKAIVEKITNDAIAMGARQVVIYGRYPFVEVTDRNTNFVSYLSSGINKYSQGNVNLLDIIQIDEPYSKSANDEGVRFRVKFTPEEQTIIKNAKTDGSYMKAPNGKLTNLNEKQWAQVRTKAFKKWFGDWENDPVNASKIVDENGEPSVVRHRTPNEFTEFDKKKIGSSTDYGAFGLGFYFSPSDFGTLYGSNMIEAFLNIKSPLQLNQSNAFDVKEPFFGDDYKWGKEQSEKFAEWAKENGYDGVHYENGGTHDEFIAFEPNQIKSATDNVGTFDEGKNDIRFRLSEKGKQIQAEVDKFTSKYNSKEVVLVDNEMTDKELEEAVPESSANRTREEISSGYPGGYSPNTDKIYIFVDNQSVESTENTMFHENLHPLFDYSELVDSFYERAKDVESKVMDIIKEKYDESEYPNELFANIVAWDITKGNFKHLEKYLTEEQQNEFFNKIKELGYDREQETSGRKEHGEVERSDSGRNKGDQLRNSEMEEGVQGEESTRRGQESGRNKSQREELGRLFRQVADMGLQGVLGNKEYTSMMVDIYKALPEVVREEIAEDALRLYGGSVAPAVSDYIGPKSKNSIIDKVVTIVREALRKVGFNLSLNANEVRYMAWRSKKPLDRNNMIEVAEDVDMKYRLKVGEYDGTTPDGGGTRFRTSEDVLNQIKQARREVEKDPSEAQKEAGNYKKGHITLDGFEITLENPKGGTRSGVDKNGKKWSITMNNDYGYIRGTEAVDGDHIDVFLSDNPTEGRVFVVDQSNEEGTFDESKVMYGFNSLDEARNAYLSNYENGWEKRIMDITEVSKDEFKKWIDSSHKKTKAFSEYKSIKSENIDIRFRVANKLQVRDEYEATIKKGGYQAREAVQDAMLSLRKFQELIEKATGKKIRDFENAWMHENRLSSIVQAEIHDMERKFYKPMMDAVKKLMSAANLEQEQVADYLMLKHGIERNREMAVRKALTDDKGKIDRTRLEQWYQDKRNVRNRAATPHLDTWRKQQEELDNIALLYGADMSHDYSGLTSMFGTDDLADSTQKAYDEVEALETAHPVETEALGKAIKAMTQNTLDKSFENGLMDRKVYDELSKDMYDYYIPLRGFEETTSEEVYAYLDQDRGAFNAPLKRAKGRSSKSDNPIAYLKSIAESGIMQGNRNKMKQSFLNLVINHPSDLVSVREGVWVIYNPASGEWESAAPPAIPNNATPADVEAAMEAWETNMERSAASDPNVKKVSEAADVPYRVVGNRMDQHQIIVKRLGKSYTLTINGNPRLAMAINGQTNPNNTSNDGKVAAFVTNKIGALNRSLAAWYTTRNPDFVASNFMRDTFYSNTIVRAKEGNAYANKFHKNYAMALPKMLGLFRKYENGTLNPADQTEAAFLDFMMNGGETGYSNLKDVEEIKKQIAKELKGNRFAKVEALAEKLDILNRALENTARFAAYLTSREEGRSIAKSIFDAKEISVNFNKKGAGGTFFGMTGQTWFGNLAAMIGASGRALYVFFNAAIQGSTNLMHVMKVNPKGTSAGLAAMFLMGAVVPFLFGGDDDDKKDYYDLPEHVRRNHLIIPGTGDAWISIPLPIEYRIMYGMGELLTSWRTGHERGTDIARKMLSMTGQALPLNFLEEGLEAFVPSAVSPIYQVMTNSSWTGLPIYKENDFNKDDPEYTKAYSNVDRNLLKFTKALYEWSFDEENQKERIDLNPAIIETLAKGYFGGLATQLSNIAKAGGMIAGEQEFDWRNIPIGNRILKTGDERTKEKRITNEYFENMEKLDFLQSRERMLKKTEKGVAVPEADKFKAQKDLETMQGTEVYKKYQEFKKQKKVVDKIRKTIKEKGSTSELEKQLMEAQEAANKSVR